MEDDMEDKKRNEIEEIKETVEGLNALLKSLDDKAKTPAASLPSGDETSESAGGILGAMDLSDPIRDVYLALLKGGDMTIEEMSADPSIEDKESLSIYLRILARQKYAEKYKAGDSVKYRAVTREKAKKEVAEDIWDLLK